MSLPQTQLKGSVTLASDAGAITTIGTIGSGTTSINSATTNIQTGTQTDNTKAINIGQTTGAFNTTTTMNGNTSISRLATPLTPVYSYPVSTAGQIGATITGTNVSPFTSTGGVLKSMSSMTLTKGLWLLCSNVNTGQLSAQGYGINSISTTSGTNTGLIGQQDATGVNLYTVKSVLTVPYSTNVDIPIYMNWQGSINNLITGVVFTATRIA